MKKENLCVHIYNRWQQNVPLKKASKLYYQGHHRRAATGAISPEVGAVSPMTISLILSILLPPPQETKA
jgi:hypothetical protein